MVFKSDIKWNQTNAHWDYFEGGVSAKSDIRFRYFPVTRRNVIWGRKKDGVRRAYVVSWQKRENRG